MRLIAILMLLAAFLLNVPGLHAVDLPHSHAGTDQETTMIASGGALPSAQPALDCHHECSHIHVADRARALRVTEPVVWADAAYPADGRLLPESAEPALPDEPPRA